MVNPSDPCSLAFFQGKRNSNQVYCHALSLYLSLSLTIIYINLNLSLSLRDRADTIITKCDKCDTSVESLPQAHLISALKK